VTQLSGRQLGRYQVEDPIGRGGMARVYQAFDTQLRRRVALKVLAPQLSLDPEFIERFQREAVTAANLRHPAIVTVYDVGEQDGLHYIAMELVRGQSLHAILRYKGALGLALATTILTPLCQALDYAHAQGAVHRDIKPHNVLIDVDGRVLLTDFGIAQVAEPEGERLTRTGMFMGTPEYISPEQARAEPVDGRSDLYSLGIVAYEMLTGQVPFAGATPQLIVAHANNLPPPLSLIDQSLPPDLDAVLDKALAKRPEDRFARAVDFAVALRDRARKHAVTPATMAQVAELVRASGVAPFEQPRPPTPQSASQASSLPSTLRGPTPPPPDGAPFQEVQPFPSETEARPSTRTTLQPHIEAPPVQNQARRRAWLLILAPSLLVLLFLLGTLLLSRTNQQSAEPTAAPTLAPTLAPTSLAPTSAATDAPPVLASPSPARTTSPTPAEPTAVPTDLPPAAPTEPQPVPTAAPPPPPTPQPTRPAITPATAIPPTPQPTLEPTVEPTLEPTVEPTLEPTVEPTLEPTVEPPTSYPVPPSGDPTGNLPTSGETSVPLATATFIPEPTNVPITPGVPPPPPPEPQPTTEPLPPGPGSAAT
jgi:serine/threonine-protein kinase